MRKITETEIDFEAAGGADHNLKPIKINQPKIALKMETHLIGVNFTIPVPKIAQGKFCRITIEVLP